MIPLAFIIAVALLPVLRWFVLQPTRTILPLYAATLPIASVVELNLPLPPPFNTLSSALGGVLLVTGFIHLAMTKKGRVPTIPVAAWLLFLAWSTLTSLWALEVGTAVETVALAVPLVGLMALVACLRVDDEDLDLLRLVIILSSITVGVYALYLLLSSSGLPSHGVSERLSIAQDPEDTNPNILAAALLLPLAVSVERVVFGGTRWLSAAGWRILGASGLFFTTIAIILTSSRGGMIAGVIVVASGLYFCSRIPEARRIVLRTATALGATVMALVVVGFISVQLAPQGIVGDLINSGPIQRIANRQTDSSGRLEIWGSGALACNSSCAWGAGFGNFPAAYSEVQAFSGAATNVGFERPAHSVYLEVAVETGLIGIALLTLAILAELFALNSPSVASISPAMSAAVIGLLLASFFLSAIWFKYFWLVFLLNRVVEGVATRSRAGSRSSFGEGETAAASAAPW